MIIDCGVYQDGKRRPGEVALHEAYEAGHADNAFVWIGLYEPDEAEFDSVRREFNLHELADVVLHGEAGTLLPALVDAAIREPRR